MTRLLGHSEQGDINFPVSYPWNHTVLRKNFQEPFYAPSFEMKMLHFRITPACRALISTA